MKYISYQTLGLLACSILTGCQAEEVQIDDKGNTLQLLSVTLDEDPASKAAVSSINTVNIYATTTESSGETALTSNPLSTYTYSGSTWSSTAAPELAGKTNIYAFYPSKTEANASIPVTHSSDGNHTIPVSILSSDTFDGKQEDYLYAAPTSASLSQKAISLEMNHTLSKITFEFTKTESATEDFTLQQVDIISKTNRLQAGSGNNVNMNIKTGELTGLAASGQISLTGSVTLSPKGSTRISALLAPMSGAEQAMSFSLTVKVGETVRTFETGTVTSDAPGWVGEQWKRGLEYVYKIKVDKMSGSFEGVSVYNWKTGADQNTQVGI